MKYEMTTDMEPGNKIGIVCCSNAWKNKLLQLEEIIRKLDLVPVRSPYIFGRESVESGSDMERAQALMDFYRDDSVKGIFDISGGDIANEILPYLDMVRLGLVIKSFGAIVTCPL